MLVHLHCEGEEQCGYSRAYYDIRKGERLNDGIDGSSPCRNMIIDRWSLVQPIAIRRT